MFQTAAVLKLSLNYILHVCHQILPGESSCSPSLLFLDGLVLFPPSISLFFSPGCLEYALQVFNTALTFLLRNAVLQGTGIKQGWSWLPCPACQPSRLTKVNLLCIKEALVEKVLCDSGTATLCPVSRRPLMLRHFVL